MARHAAAGQSQIIINRSTTARRASAGDSPRWHHEDPRRQWAKILKFNASRILRLEAAFRRHRKALIE